MTIDDAVCFETDQQHAKITQKLKPLQDVGLGYVQLDSLPLPYQWRSIKNKVFFPCKGAARKSVVCVDEPTTGLQFPTYKNC
jgi:excinuclease ABC subunit A